MHLGDCCTVSGVCMFLLWVPEYARGTQDLSTPWYHMLLWYLYATVEPRVSGAKGTRCQTQACHFCAKF